MGKIPSPIFFSLYFFKNNLKFKTFNIKYNMKGYEETKNSSVLSDRENFKLKESHLGVKKYIDFAIIRILQYIYDIKNNANKKIFIINVISFLFSFLFYDII